MASNLYEDTVRTALCSTRWRFATNQAELNRLTNAPSGRYDAAYQLPADNLMVHAATVQDLLIEYTLYGNKLFCNQSPTDAVIVDYTFRALEQDFPSYFTLALEFTLGSMFAMSIARDEQLGALLERKAAQLTQQARTLDSQQQTTRKLTTSRFITERRS